MSHGTRLRDPGLALAALLALAVSPLAAQDAPVDRPAGHDATGGTVAVTNVTLIDGTAAPPRPGMTVDVVADRAGFGGFHPPH